MPPYFLVEIVDFDSFACIEVLEGRVGITNCSDKPGVHVLALTDFRRRAVASPNFGLQRIGSVTALAL